MAVSKLLRTTETAARTDDGPHRLRHRNVDPSDLALKPLGKLLEPGRLPLPCAHSVVDMP